MNTRRVIAVAAAVTLVLVALPASTSAANSKCWKYNEAELKFVKKVNNARVAGTALRNDPELSKVARKHTKEMIAAGGIYHSSEKQFRQRATRWTVIGENIGGPGSNVNEFHEAFMASPGHRLNLVDPAFTHVGIGVVWDDGDMWVTQIFTGTSNPGTRLKMPNCKKVRERRRAAGEQREAPEEVNLIPEAPLPAPTASSPPKSATTPRTNTIPNLLDLFLTSRTRR